MESHASVAVFRGSSLAVAGPGLGVALRPEGGTAAGVGVGPAGRRGHGAAGRGGEAGPRLEGARRRLGAAVGGGLRGLRGVGLRGEVARRVLRRLLRRQLLRLPREGGGRGRGSRLAVGRELLGLLRRGLLLAVACWKGKEQGGVRDTKESWVPAARPFVPNVHSDKRKTMQEAQKRQTKRELPVFLPFT